MGGRVWCVTKQTSVEMAVIYMPVAILWGLPLTFLIFPEYKRTSAEGLLLILKPRCIYIVAENIQNLQDKTYMKRQ